ncbi:eukaryotic translation initiation factor 3 subunit A-like [Musca autumnalis]|uniref:eukaryotic translation initiation factor 3 subunit A-like n=1 Tax=Musca autumnalis TaxID=221902 RepID=UPI003CE7362A
MQRMASHVLIATLSIPLSSAKPEFDRFIEADKSLLEKAQQLSVLLGLQQPPTGASLLKEVVRLSVGTMPTRKPSLSLSCTSNCAWSSHIIKECLF